MLPNLQSEANLADFINMFKILCTINSYSNVNITNKLLTELMQTKHLANCVPQSKNSVNVSHCC